MEVASFAVMDPKKLGERLKKLRKEAGLTQAQLAMCVNLSTGAIGNYEAGTRAPSIDALVAMGEYFGVSIDYLVGRTNYRRGVPDPLEIEWPDAIKLLQRASRMLSPRDKAIIVTLIRSMLDHERKKEDRAKIKQHQVDA